MKWVVEASGELRKRCFNQQSGRLAICLKEIVHLAASWLQLRRAVQDYRPSSESVIRLIRVFLS